MVFLLYFPAKERRTHLLLLCCAPTIPGMGSCPEDPLGLKTGTLIFWQFFAVPDTFWSDSLFHLHE